MGCCGDKRKKVVGYGYSSVRWQGLGPIKVHGSVTGRTYRFDGYGSVVVIDERDLKNAVSIPQMFVVGQ